MLQELLEVEFDDFLGAKPYERSEARRYCRNGYRECGLIAPVGRLTLRIPRDRQSRFPGHNLRLHRAFRTLSAQ
ncbi:MAG TPA: hypothetical protein ENL35_09825 [Chloroflexi bacterium]|nr:hypothetical protein [Chloroflexota bacterium]